MPEPPTDPTPGAVSPDALRVVVLGGGFGGLALVQGLAQHANEGGGGRPIEVTLVDRQNHHLFQPLLYQVATAALGAEAIAQPVRSIMRGSHHLAIRMAEAVGLERDTRRLLLNDGSALAYDILVVAAGVRYDYFGHEEWRALAPSLKTLEDAAAIRAKLLLAFEQAETTDDAATRQRLLTFVLIGGGPTGVELAGSIVELARFTLRRDFRHIDPTTARIILVEAAPRLLGGFDERLADYARRTLERMGVEIQLGCKIENIDETGLTTASGHIDAALVLWCAGVGGREPATWLGVETTRKGLVAVAPDLTVPGEPSIYVVGDLAKVEGPGGRPLPQVAPVAKQQGAYVAEAILARVAGRPAPAPFRYKDWGSLAIIGRSAAIADLGRIRLTGHIGWLVWGLAHIFFLISFSNRIGVFLTWGWEWLTERRGARLIQRPPTPAETRALKGTE